MAWMKILWLVLMPVPVVLTGSGSGVVPASKFRAMLVGGGAGGSSGGKGEDGGNSVFEEGNAGAGGVSGSAGIGGKILTVEMEADIGATISYSCGAGGAGGGHRGGHCPILAGLGQMYVADERFKKNIDKYGEGTAEFAAEAIAVYCRKA